MAADQLHMMSFHGSSHRSIYPSSLLLFMLLAMVDWVMFGVCVIILRAVGLDCSVVRCAVAVAVVSGHVRLVCDSVYVFGHGLAGHGLAGHGLAGHGLAGLRRRPGRAVRLVQKKQAHSGRCS